MPVSDRIQRIIRGAKKVAARRKAAKATLYPNPEETIHVSVGLEARPPGTATYTPPAPYRVLQLVKK